MTTVSEPKIDERPEQPYMGIRKRVPMRSMSKEVGKLFNALNQWGKQNRVETSGPPFLRYHVIDMTGMMDIEAGVPVAAVLPDDGMVRADRLPAGRYASLVYTGSGLTGNKALLVWGKANGLTWDRWEDPNGDAFGARYETYLTDPKVEPRKTRWEIEVAIKLAEG